MTKEPSRLPASLRAFAHRDFTLFWSGALVSNIGVWLSNLTVPFVLFQLTQSALWTSLASVAQFLPSFLLGPVAGWLADRFERRKVLLFTQGGLAAAAVALWLGWLLEWRTPGMLIGMVLLQGIFQGLNTPSWQSFVHDLVPREDLRSAVTLNSVQFNSARSIGPAIAGAVIGILGPASSFGLNALSFVGVLIALAIIPNRRAHGVGANPGSFASAVRYLKTQPGIIVAVVLAAAVSFLVNPILQFTVVFAGSVFNVGPWPLGLMNAGMGLGSLIGLPLVAGSIIRTRAGVVKLGLVLIGVGLVGFGLSPGWVFSVGCLVLIGFGFLAAISSSNTAIQLIVAQHFRGRVMAIRIMTYQLAYPLGAFVTGALSDYVGPRAVMVGSGVCLLAVWLLFSLQKGRLSLDRLDDPYDEG